MFCATATTIYLVVAKRNLNQNININNIIQQVFPFTVASEDLQTANVIVSLKRIYQVNLVMKICFVKFFFSSGNDADINRPKPKPYNFKSKEAQSSKNLGDVRVSTSEFGKNNI